jgi:quercetin dioxygenase-like cupin family protein
MTPTATVLTDYGSRRDLVGPVPAPRYVFVEHTLAPGRAVPFRSDPLHHRTFVVLRSEVALELPDGSTAGRYRRLEGWHAPAGSAYRFTNRGSGTAVLLEAGSVGERVGCGNAAPGPFPAISTYAVAKPWGHEIWYTQNLPDPGYAVKQIHMTAGHQSSLQSHRWKAETNHVVDGAATVLAGLTAPADPDEQVDVSLLVTTVHPAGSGWTSPPGELHRVIARTDYTAIEVSTPELDDVIRWQDDTGRAHGRIAEEHAGGRS